MMCCDVIGVLANILFLLYFPYLTNRVATSCMEPVSNHWEYLLSYGKFLHRT
jgi:hypothetical protein